MRVSVLFAAIVLALASAATAVAEPMETKAPVALLVDVNTGSLLLEKASDKPIAPASMAKMMTVAVVLDSLDKGEITLESEFAVSETAWRTGGAPSGTATMFAALKSRVRVADLLRGVMVQAANDACLILAEGISGSESAFVERMNKAAKEIGLADTRFANPTGFPDPEQVTSARDLAKLAGHLRTKDPEIFAIYAEPDFTWNKVFQKNKNPLLALGIGADGIVAGATPEGTFGLVGSAARDGRRLILVLAGLPSAQDRAAEAKRLIDWGFSAFVSRPVFADGVVVGSVDVFGGGSWSVPVKTAGSVTGLFRNDAQENVEAAIVYKGPVPAPVREGQPIGELRLSRDGQAVLRAPLVAAQDVDVGPVPTRALGSIIELFAGLWHKGKNAL